MSKTKSTCVSCDGTLLQFLEAVIDTRFGVEGNFDIYKCNHCGLVQLDPRPSDSELKSLYETYYNFGGSKKNLYTKLRRTFLGSVFYRIWLAIDGDICFHSRCGNGRLLDIGCNEGQGLQIYKQNGFRPEGLELNRRAATIAEKRGFLVFNETLESFSPSKSYDLVVLSHVLEHFVNPKEMLVHVRRILNLHGQVLISCPNIESFQRNIFGRYWINWHVPFHITFFSATTLKSLLNDCGFDVLKVRCVSPALWVAQSVIAALFAVKGKKTYTQRSSILLGSLMLFTRFALFPALWFGNLLGRGDCLVLEAVKRQ